MQEARQWQGEWYSFRLEKQSGPGSPRALQTESSGRYWKALNEGTPWTAWPSLARWNSALVLGLESRPGTMLSFSFLCSHVYTCLLVIRDRALGWSPSAHHPLITLILPTGIQAKWWVCREGKEDTAYAGGWASSGGSTRQLPGQCALASECAAQAARNSLRPPCAFC